LSFLLDIQGQKRKYKKRNRKTGAATEEEQEK